MTHLISIVRRSNELTALVTKRVEGEAGGIELVWVRLAELKESIYPEKERLLESWGPLGEIAAVDEQTLYDLFVVLLETVPDPSSAKNVSPLPVEWNSVPVPPKATRAHPRAFKGTKFQPPKPGRLPQTDMRPHMCDADLTIPERGALLEPANRHASPYVRCPLAAKPRLSAVEIRGKGPSKTSQGRIHGRGARRGCRRMRPKRNPKCALEFSGAIRAVSVAISQTETRERAIQTSIAVLSA
jgi:hypothetical protein